MSDWIYGFFMAWGMFLTIPCPKKIWRESARRKMLACLPLIGLIVGGIWALCAWLGSFLPQPLAALLCAAAPWLITGFMHLDGYMDVCDAVLSRPGPGDTAANTEGFPLRGLRGDLSGAAGPVPMGGISVGGGAAPLAADADTCGITSLCSTGRSDTAAHVHQPVQRHDPRAAHLWYLPPLCWRRCAGSPYCCGTALLRWLRRCAIGWRHGTLSGSWMVCPAMCQASP